MKIISCTTINPFITEQAIKLVLEMANESAKYLMNNDQTASPNNKDHFLFVAAQGPGFSFEAILGDHVAANNHGILKEPVHAYTGSARWKLEKTMESQMTTGEMVREHPSMLCKNEWLYPGSWFDPKTKTAVGTGGALGDTDELISAIIGNGLIMMERLNGSAYQSSETSKANKGKIVID